MEQHEMFQDGLHTLKEYCGRIEKSPSKYDGNQVTIMIDSFASAFVHHLHEEIDTLSPEKLRAIFPNQDDLKKIHTDMIKWKIANSSKMKILPWVILTIVRLGSEHLDAHTSRVEDCTMVANRGYSCSSVFSGTACLLQVQ